MREGGNEIEYVEGGRLYDYNYKNSDDDPKIWAAPTLWGAMKWLREVHNVTIVPISISFKKKVDIINGNVNYTLRAFLKT